MKSFSLLILLDKLTYNALSFTGVIDVQRAMSFTVFPLYGTLFPTAGFSHRVYRRGFNEAIGIFHLRRFACCLGAQQEGKCCNIFIFILYGEPLWCPFITFSFSSFMANLYGVPL
jgi:hypothetical protein